MPKSQNDRDYRIFQELIAPGIHAEPAVYAGDIADEVHQQPVAVDAVLIGIHPIHDGQTILDTMVRDVASRGPGVSVHPDVTLRLHRSSSLGTPSRTYCDMLKLNGDEWWRPMPDGASTDALRILAARSVRAFADGFVALLLPIYLYELGFGSLLIGTIVASTLVGTALVTLWVGWVANRYSRRILLLVSATIMVATGLGFAIAQNFWPLLFIAFVGTINPTSGDASIFLPLEQTVLTQTIEPRRRTALFARYSIVGSLAGALGTLAASAPDFVMDWAGLGRSVAIQIMFVLYTTVEFPHQAPQLWPGFDDFQDGGD